MRTALLLFLVLAALPAAAVSPSERALAEFAAATGQFLPPSPQIAVPAPSPAPAPPSAWTGSFRIVYSSATSADSRRWKRILQKTRILDDAVAGLGRQLYLPADLVIEVKECGEANAWYDPDTRRITYCYDYVADAARLLKSRVEPASQVDRYALGSALHTLYHEVGHALIDIYGLPAVGREEDAVDQFATLVLLGNDAGEVAATTAALEFLQGWTEDRHLRFWDEHSFDKVRYYDTLCLIYGKDPEKNASMVTDKILPKDRAERCPAEYAKLDAAWDKLLAPYLKPEAAARP
ncbi:MAG: DUF4344 domain-containing metallopeptidase [Elusimicrobiota bacterium]